MPADRPDAVPGLGFESIKVGDPVARILWCRIWCLDTMLLLDSVHRLSSILVCPFSRIYFRVPNSLSPVACILFHWSIACRLVHLLAPNVHHSASQNDMSVQNTLRRRGNGPLVLPPHAARGMPTANDATTNVARKRFMGKKSSEPHMYFGEGLELLVEG